MLHKGESYTALVIRAELVACSLGMWALSLKTGCPVFNGKSPGSIRKPV